jgi:uncharacterized membrane protein
MQIRSLNFGRGMDWITEGFGLFRQNPLIWIVIGVLYIVLSSIISLIPGIGAVALTLVTPVLSAGLMAGCRDLDLGDELRIEHLFEGFRHNTQTLLMVGLLTLAGYFVVALVGVGAFLLLGGAAAGMGMLEGDFPAPNSPEALPMMGGMLVAVLVMLALIVPVAMAAWFAPPLVWFRNLPALEAMKQSFIGCWRNILPFLLYGLAAFVLLIIATIPFGLGLLVLGPTLVGSVYASYQDIYGDTDRA